MRSVDLRLGVDKRRQSKYQEHHADLDLTNNREHRPASDFWGSDNGQSAQTDSVKRYSSPACAAHFGREGGARIRTF
jgi:hypothetical protein